MKNALWEARGDEKRERLKKMFAEIAPSYDVLNSLMSFRLHHRWRAKAVARLDLQEGDQALDLCCGTGDFLKLLMKEVGKTGHAVGIDFCLPMLQLAEKKLGGEVHLALADACSLAFRSESFHAVSVGWGIRNVPDIDEAHREAFRVLKPGGRFVSLDMAVPEGKFFGHVSKQILGVLTPILGRLFGQSEAYTYLPKSVGRFLSREQLQQSMIQVGFKDTGFQDLMLGNLCMHWGTKR